MKKRAIAVLLSIMLFVPILSSCVVSRSSTPRTVLPKADYESFESLVITDDMAQTALMPENRGSVYESSLQERLPYSVIFKLGENNVYLKSEKKTMGQKVICNADQDLFYIAASDIATLFGGRFENNILLVNARRVVFEEDKAVLTDELGAFSGEMAINFIIKDGTYYIESASVSDIFSFNLYATDSGILIFSNGKVLDENSGYYIAEQANTLFNAEFSTANMFVDLPSVYTNGKFAATVYTYSPLNLHAQVTAYEKQGVRSSVALAPSIVAGEGENPENGTIVRVFDRYQTLSTQFSAYKPSVKGGVYAVVGAFADGYNILTAPCTDETVKQLKVYNINGGFEFEIIPTGNAPFTVAAGDFVSNGVDCFAVMSKNSNTANRTIEFFSCEDGKKIFESRADFATGRGELCVKHIDSDIDGFIVNLPAEGKAFEAYCSGITDKFTSKAGINGFYPSFTGKTYFTEDDSTFSYVTDYNSGTKINVGEKENLIFSSIADQRDDTYMRYGEFDHIRTDWNSSAIGNLCKNGYASIRQNNYAQWVTSCGYSENDKNTYIMPEPCFTHRWFQNDTGFALRDCIDKNTGLPRYAALTTKNETSTEAEGFIVGSYAPYIPELERMRTWSQRSALQTFAPYYKQNADHVIAVSPVHEQEISVTKSVGDYNPKMIVGFRNYMLDKYGSYENINRIFNANFTGADDFDAPRSLRRGKWDRYVIDNTVTNPYYFEWVYYLRNIVSSRIIEAYREALLAGIPPEMIKAHQIPESSAVPDFLNMGLRVTPTDVVLSCGTAYGGTRYGNWLQDPNNFIALARKSGHVNTTLGEYSETSTNQSAKYDQYKYMFDNGVMMIHYINITGQAERDAETAATLQIQNENQPRTASCGGVGAIHPYKNGKTAYDIVEIGTKADNAGLLKSVNENGDFEGSVYLQPFHAKVVATELEKEAESANSVTFVPGARTGSSGTEYKGIRCGDAADVRVNVNPTGNGSKVVFKAYQNGILLNYATVTFEADRAGEYRYYFSNQLNLENVEIIASVENAEITSSEATFIYERTARDFYQEHEAEPFKGGVNFDLIYK